MMNTTLIHQRILLVLCMYLTCSVSICFSQSLEDEIKADRESYLWGEGTGNTMRVADEEALADLISQIFVVVSSQFENSVNERTIKETNGEREASFEQEVSSIIKTYSQSALHNTERIVLQDAPDARVFRYIRRDDVTKVFESRKQRIIDYIKIGENNEAHHRISDALQYYSWALVLLKSHPEADLLTIDHLGREEYTHAYLVRRINAILDDISVTPVEVRDDHNHREVTLLFTFRGQMVVNLDFTFWTGTDWSKMHSAKKGRALIDFYGENAKNWSKTNLRIECTYADQLFGDRELEEVFRWVHSPDFPKSRREIKFSKSRGDKAFPEPKSASKSAIDKDLSTDQSSLFYDRVSKVIDAVQQKRLEDVAHFFTPEGLEVCEMLLEYGNARIADHREFTVYSYRNTSIVRGCFLAFNFEKGYTQFVEEVIFHFNEDSQISNIVFGLGEKAVNDIHQRPWPLEEKMILVNFLEQYKTAYALKNLDYIEKIFDEDAIIITGTVVKSAPEHVIDGVSPLKMFANNEFVRYNRYSKNDFIKRLKHVFSSKDFINIDFEDNNVRKSDVDHVFGIQIKQNYRSNNYSDQGYLFLMIDCLDPVNPIIHIRTWQPEKDETGQVFGLGNF